MRTFNLDAKLMEFGTGDDLSQPYCIKHSILGIACFGSNGSGKSSGMRTVALKMLRAGYGFLVLSAKKERETWEEYCRLAGRSGDLIRIGEDSPHRFDFMRYLSESKSGTALTSNLLNILKAVIETDGQKESGNSDPFWSKSLNLLLHNTISLSQLANGSVSIQGMYDIVQSAPVGSEDNEEAPVENKDSPFSRAFETVRAELSIQVQNWQAEWTDEEKELYSNRVLLETAILTRFPKARQFKFIEQFFFETFKTLSFKTRSIIILSLSSFLFSLLQSPIYDLFCSGEISVTPEDTLKGKVILLDLPTKYYHSAGRSAQLLFKYIWQLQMEKRNLEDNDRPVCLWSDECPEFIMPEHDSAFQATARSSMVSVVYIAQNMHQYYGAVGGPKSSDKIASFLGTLNTKLYFSNSCTTTNRCASELIGDALFFDPSRSITTAENFSQTDSVSLKLDRLVRPEKFLSMMTGG